MGFFSCVKYLATTGLLGFIVGRILPKRWFKADAFPYREYTFECGGRFYHKMKIRSWQNKLPDMSRILPWCMPPKRLPGKWDAGVLIDMIRETCVAEIVHIAHAIAGLGCLILWDGLGGVVMAFLTAVGNLPFVLVQRYNRPRFQKLLERERSFHKNQGVISTEITV